MLGILSGGVSQRHPKASPIFGIGINPVLQVFQAHFSDVVDILAYENDGNNMATAPRVDAIID